MKKSRDLQRVIGSSKIYLKRNSSTILTAIGAVGVVVTSILTAKATIKAFEIVNEEECEKKRELTKKEMVVLAGPSYFSAILVGASTIACILGANALNKRQQAMLSSAYAFVNASFKEYKNKVKELYGEETHSNVVNAIAVEKAKESHIASIYIGGECNLPMDDSEPRLFYDEFSERYFEATTEQVLEAEYHLNRNYILRGYATLNEFYDLLGLEKTDYGDTLGWEPLDEGLFWIDFNHRKVVMEDELECYFLEMPFEPMTREYIDEHYYCYFSQK